MPKADSRILERLQSARKDLADPASVSEASLDLWAARIRRTFRAWSGTWLEKFERSLRPPGGAYYGEFPLGDGGHNARQMNLRLADKTRRKLLKFMDEALEAAEAEVEQSESALFTAPSPASAFSSLFSPPKPSPQRRDGRKVFVVHGHDTAARESVARVLERLGLEPVILAERANEGRTIIEKFEQHSDVAYVVVLLTADDVGYAKGQTKAARARARQNVILELGYFMGKRGRRYVCALYEHGVELPSDLHGILWIELDSRSAWMSQLVGELQAAGIAVDANRLLRR